MSSAHEVSIEVTRVHKRFRIPDARADTLKQRVVHPRQSERHRELRVLEDISFRVRRGEFFGVVGRNGSGKSTLLKLLASVYSADSGRIRVAGVVAPVIELGVGFQPELSARENVLMNGLMMGLTPKQARSRFDAVIDFAELRDFTELKLKNYSAGMRVRLAFAIVMQTDPDVILLDEVLAVGDPPFQRRCEAVFAEFREASEKTVLLVTHSMPSIERHCDRAMLLEDGRVAQVGSPARVARQYEELKSVEPLPKPRPTPAHDLAPVRVLRVACLDREGTSVTTVAEREPIRLEIGVEADGPADDPRLLLQLNSQVGVLVFGPPPIELEGGAALEPGRPIAVKARIENRLPPGRYTASCSVAVGPRGTGALVSRPAQTEFELPARPRPGRGVVDLDYQVRVDDADGSGGAAR